MPAPDENRDPFEKTWERIATVWANIEALSQPDVLSISAIHRRVALALSTPKFDLKAYRFCTNNKDPDNCADRAASNLRLIVKEVSEKSVLLGMAPDERAWTESKLDDLAKLLRQHYSLQLGRGTKGVTRLDGERLNYLAEFG